MRKRVKLNLFKQFKNFWTGEMAQQVMVFGAMPDGPEFDPQNLHGGSPQDFSHAQHRHTQTNTHTGRHTLSKM